MIFNPTISTRQSFKLQKPQVCGHITSSLSGTFVPVIFSFTLSLLLHHIKIFVLLQCLRPYHLEYTSSRPITEVKQG